MDNKTKITKKFIFNIIILSIMGYFMNCSDNNNKITNHSIEANYNKKDNLDIIKKIDSKKIFNFVESKNKNLVTPYCISISDLSNNTMQIKILSQNKNKNFILQPNGETYNILTSDKIRNSKFFFNINGNNHGTVDIIFYDSSYSSIIYRHYQDNYPEGENYFSKNFEEELAYMGEFSPQEYNDGDYKWYSELLEWKYTLTAKNNNGFIFKKVFTYYLPDVYFDGYVKVIDTIQENNSMKIEEHWVWAKGTKDITVKFRIDKVVANPPSKVILNKPDENSNWLNFPITFNWYPASGLEITNYQLQVANDNDCHYIIRNEIGGLNFYSFTVRSLPLNNNRVYYWRVRAKNEAGWGEWSDVRNFDIKPFACEIKKIYDSNCTVQLKAIIDGAYGNCKYEWYHKWLSIGGPGIKTAIDKWNKINQSGSVITFYYGCANSAFKVITTDLTTGQKDSATMNLWVNF